MKKIRLTVAAIAVLTSILLSVAEQGVVWAADTADTKTTVAQERNNTQIVFAGGAQKFIAPDTDWVDFSMMDPGESRIQAVTLTNSSTDTMKYYMGVSIPDNIASVPGDAFFYDVRITSEGQELLSYRVNGNQTKEEEREKQFATLAPGESETALVELTLDGASMTNQYQGSQGKLRLTFTTQSPNVARTAVKKTTVIKTGDNLFGKIFCLAGILAIASVAIAGVLARRHRQIKL